MANRNTLRTTKLLSKQAKTGVAVNSAFGQPGNLNRTKKNYQIKNNQSGAGQSR